MSLRGARLACFPVAAVIGLALFDAGCSEGSAPSDEAEQRSTYNRVDCEVSLTELHDERLEGIAVLDPTAKRISEKERIRHLNEITRFSDAMLDVLRVRHVPIQLTGGSVVEFAEFAGLKGQVPRGWDGTGYTWDDVPGTGTERGIFLGDSGKPNNAWSLALHEGTHAVDRAVGFSVGSTKLRALYADELTRPESAGDSNARYRRSHIEEYFAVGVDELRCNGTTRARLHSLYPSLEAFLVHDLDAELVARLGPPGATDAGATDADAGATNRE
jgi:hypothetical protein